MTFHENSREAEILERCLRRLEQGADLEACLKEVPEALPLRPLLEAALWLQRGQAASLPAAARQRLIRQGQSYAAQRAAHPQASGRAFRWAWAMAVVLGLLLGLLGIGGAAEASLPGEPLYPVKRAVEGLVTMGMSPAGKALYLAERRWSEFEVAASRGRWLPDLAEESLGYLEEALRVGAGRPVGGETRLRALYERQGVLLEQAAQDAPPDIRARLAQARQRRADLAMALGYPGEGIPTPSGVVETPLPPAPTAEILRERARTPPGLEKQATPPALHTPPGLEKRETPRPERTPPGQQKKGTPPPERTPPGQEKQATPRPPRDSDASSSGGQGSKDSSKGRR